MGFLGLRMGLRLWEPVGVERGRGRGRWFTRQQPQCVAALAAIVAPAHHTPSHPPLLAGQQMYTGDRCDADTFEIPRLKRKPVRVGCATGQLWGPTTRRLLGGKVCHSNVPIWAS
jgi:hypothetical protein